MKKLIPALAMLLIAAVLMGTSTYAWFSMNTTVSATGMSLTATTPVNLLISPTGVEDPNSFTNAATADEVYTGKLFPASSVAGVKFNAIENSGNYIGAGAGGVAENTTKFQKDSDQNGTKVVTMSGANDGYWAEYTYWLKLSEHQTNAADVYLSSLEIYRPYVAVAGDTDVAANTYYTKDGTTYTAVAEHANLTAGNTYYMKDGVCGAVRVLLNVASDAASQATNVIYAIDGTAANAINQAVTADETPFEGMATQSVTPVSSFTNANSFKVNDTKIAVVLKVWIEGQDGDCVNANAGQQFDFQIAFAVNTAA